MTVRQERFIAEYLIDGIGKQAAIRAGYKPSAAESTASTLLADPKISQAIKDGQAQKLARAGVTADRVLQEMARLAFSDVSRLFNANGSLKALHELTPDDSACIAGLEVIIKNAEAGDGHTDKVHKIKVWDKSKNLEMLAKHFGLFIEKVEHSGGVSMRWLRDDEPTG